MLSVFTNRYSILAFQYRNVPKNLSFAIIIEDTNFHGGFDKFYTVVKAHVEK